MNKSSVVTCKGLPDSYCLPNTVRTQHDGSSGRTWSGNQITRLKVCSRKGTWYAWAFIATGAHLDEHYNLTAQYWNLSGSIGNPWEINLKFIHNLCSLSGSMYKHCSLDWLEWSNSDVAQARTWVQHSHFSPLQWVHWARRTKLCYCAYRLRRHSSRAWKWAPAPKLDHQALAAPPWWLHLGSCGIIPLLPSQSLSPWVQ